MCYPAQQGDFSVTCPRQTAETMALCVIRNAVTFPEKNIYNTVLKEVFFSRGKKRLV